MNSVQTADRIHTIARQLGCSTRTIRRRIQTQAVPAIRIGRRAWGVRASDLNRLARILGGGYV
jgi:excisionase family DNA binding protein